MCIKSIHLESCPNSPANYAYVNCTNPLTAGLVVEHLDGKCFHFNLLTAKLKKVSKGGEGFVQSTGVSAKDQQFQAPGPTRDVAIVKVLIHAGGGDVTDKHLDLYFARFGELTSLCILRSGTPDYSYLNFKDPLSAQEVRKWSANGRPT